LVIEACLVCRSLGTLVGIERPLDMVFRQTMAEDGAAVVEDHAIGLAVGWTQTASDHLPEQAHLLRWSGQDDATNIGTIKPRGQHHAIGDDFGLSALEPRQYRVARIRWRRAVEMLGTHSRLHELVADMDGMSDVTGEGYSAPTLAVFVPVCDD